jgi:hypothetical protein
MTPNEIRAFKRRLSLARYRERRNKVLTIKRAACIYRPRMKNATVLEAERVIIETGISIRKYAAEIDVHYSALARKLKALRLQRCRQGVA